VSLVETQTIFERIVTGHDVEQWVIETLHRWSSTYLAEIERQHGYEAGAISRVKGWAIGASFDKWPEDQLPAVLVISPGIVPPPMKEGSGSYRARWRVDVGVICSANTQEKSHEQAMLFVAAHKAIVVQRPSLEGRAAGAVWLDESYDALDYDDTRSLYGATVSFAIDVENVLTTLAGPIDVDDPRDPDTDEWPLWTTVRTHDEDVRHVPDIDEGGTNVTARS